MLGLILGVLVVVLGTKASTPTGIPLTREKEKSPASQRK